MITILFMLNKNKIVIIKNVLFLSSGLMNILFEFRCIIVEEVHKFLKNFNIRCVISDISPIGALLGEKLKVKSI